MDDGNQKALLLGIAAGQPLLRGVAAFCVFEAAFYVAYHYAMSFSQMAASPFWFPDSVLLCALLLARPAWWWLVILGPLPIRLLCDVPPDTPLWFLLTAYGIDSAKGLAVAAALRLVTADPLRLRKVRDLCAYGAIAVLLVPALAALAGGAARYARGFDYWDAVEQWFLGNALTHVVVTPAILYWIIAGDWLRAARSPRRVEAGLLAIGLVMSGYLVFGTQMPGVVFADPRLYAPVPFLLWAAIRFGMPGTSGAIALLTFFAVFAMLADVGPFSGASPAETREALQYFLLLGAAPLYLIAVLIQQKQAVEEYLRESEQRFRSVADSAPVMIWLSDAERRCEFVNRGWRDFTGRTLEQERGRGWVEGVHPDDEPHRGEISDAAIPARQPYEVEYRLRRHDGEYRWVLDRGSPRYAPNGAFLGYVGSAIDITERRRTEEAKRSLAHISRLAALGELTALLAHEVNQPLTAILANADAARILLRRDDPPLGEIREIIEDIRQSDLRADEVIRRVRELMRTREIRLATLDLDETVGDVLRFVAGDALQRGVTLRRQSSSRLPAVQGDRVHLQQVLLNLIVNAMDAMHDSPAGAREIEVAAKRDGSRVEVSVSDRGHGIAPEDLRRIFDAFVTTKKNGTGLGLSFAASIIESHGGRIWAENNPGGGATFRFTLPI